MRARAIILLIPLLAVLASAGCAPSAEPAPAPKPAAPPLGGAAAVDADVRQVYESFVQREMPGVPIELLQAAKREGSISYYHLASPVYTKLIAAFAERVPFVKVQAFQLTGAALVEKFRAEETAGTHIADVWINTVASAADEMVKLGLAMEYTLTSGSKFPAKLHDPGRWYPPGLLATVAAWNTKLIPDADAKRLLTTWQGLADPYWQGKPLGYLDFRSGGAAQAAMFVFEKLYGIQLWEAMAKNKYNFYNSGGPMSDALAAGEIAMAAYGLADSLVYPRWKAGAPIHYTYSSPFITATYAQLISKSAPHPNAAKLFHEYVFSRVGQQILMDDGLLSLRDDVKDQRDVTKEPWYTSPGKPYEIDRHELGAKLEQLGKDYDRIFKRK